MATGTLVLVATPIGNLGDLSPRAVEALAAADVICCEDTRRTGRLLAHAGVARPKLIVANEHTEASAAAETGRLLAAGHRVAVVTDAGMPAVSDPGARLVRAALAGSHDVEVVPGPSAAVAAIALSGLPADRWVFEGFVPRKGRQRAERLSEIAAERRTVVVYEAPHRLARTLDDLLEACDPSRPIAIARELTKLHEEVWRGTLADAAEWARRRQPPGEIVIVLGGTTETVAVDDDAIRAALDEARAGGASTRDAVAETADRLGVPKRRVYDLATTTR